MIDTSSARSALAIVQNGEALAEDVVEAGRAQVLASRTAALVDLDRLTGVAVALGPGSFTGLRVGVSYGVGLALGLGVPLWGLDSLVLQAARSPEPATALVEAGRDRVYWLENFDSDPAHGDPAQLPRDRPAVGWLRPRTAALVAEAGTRLLDDGETIPFAQAAAGLLPKAKAVGYGTVKIRYMQSFGPLRGQRW